ncbi:hypothetical protein KFE25_003699 [Diacronema lutheri]|uniref:Uncharacterized protein n=1 Tax=Diacronema lutheri TaxID=2081491 RepID=A0A8J5XE74_DIALT|nr:hypothetical protein KFE25_003699 [Diacronema lutheri]
MLAALFVACTFSMRCAERRAILVGAPAIGELIARAPPPPPPVARRARSPAGQRTPSDAAAVLADAHHTACGLCVRHRCTAWHGYNCAAHYAFSDPQGSQLVACTCSCCHKQCRPAGCAGVALPLVSQREPCDDDSPARAIRGSTNRVPRERAILVDPTGRAPVLLFLLCAFLCVGLAACLFGVVVDTGRQGRGGVPPAAFSA